MKRTKIDPILAAADAAGLGITTLRMLIAVSHSNLRMSELAEITGKSTAAMTGAVDQLEKLGLVKRSPSSLDRRAMLVMIADKGREFIKSNFDVQ